MLEMRSAVLVRLNGSAQQVSSRAGWGIARSTTRRHQVARLRLCRRTAVTPGGSSGGTDDSDSTDAFEAAGAPPAWRERLQPGVQWKVQWQVGAGAAPSSTSASPAVGGAPGSPQPPAADSGPECSSGANSGGPNTDFKSSFKWTRFDRGSAVRAAALADSGWDEATFETRLTDLAAVLPDLRRRLPELPLAVLLAALRNPRAAAAQVVTLKAALPGLDVGALMLCHPPFMDPDAWPPARLAAGAAHAAAVLGGQVAAEGVLQWYPPLLDPELLDGSVAQLRRLVPQLVNRHLPPVGMAAATNTEAALDEQLGGKGQPRGTPAGARSRNEPDSKELVHLLGIVMKRAAGEEGGERGPAPWWEAPF
eukprot:XP_001690615.1 predicted protein [Chlamydomonas reinhardtii]